MGKGKEEKVSGILLVFFLVVFLFSFYNLKLVEKSRIMIDVHHPYNKCTTPLHIGCCTFGGQESLPKSLSPMCTKVYNVLMGDISSIPSLSHNLQSPFVFYISLVHALKLIRS
jgi:hypothetical protein